MEQEITLLAFFSPPPFLFFFFPPLSSLFIFRSFPGAGAHGKAIRQKVVSGVGLKSGFRY